MVQFTEQLLPTPEDHGSNPALSKLFGLFDFKLTFFFVPQMLLELVAVLLVDPLLTLLQGCVFKSQSYYSKSTKK